MKAVNLPRIRRRLDSLGSLDRRLRLRELVRGAARAGIDLAGLRSRTGLEFSTILEELQAALASGTILQVSGDPPRFLDGELFRARQNQVTAMLKAFHQENPLQPGLSKEEIRSRFFRHEPSDVFRHFLVEAVRQKRVRVDRDLVALHGHRVALEGAEAGASAKLEEAYRSAGLNPPDQEELMSRLDLPRKKAEEIFFLLLKKGSLVRIKEGRIFHEQALETLKRKVWEYGRESDTIDIAAFKDLSGTSRKNAIPLLEYLDSLRVTRRDGNKRKILPPRP